MFVCLSACVYAACFSVGLCAYAYFLFCVLFPTLVFFVSIIFACLLFVCLFVCLFVLLPVVVLLLVVCILLLDVDIHRALDDTFVVICVHDLFNVFIYCM